MINCDKVNKRCADNQSQRNAGVGSVSVRVKVMFEYEDFLHFDFRGINLRHYY